MFDWEAALRTLDMDFDNEGSGGGGEYQDPLYGEIQFLWRSNKKHLWITWLDVSQICLCGKDYGPTFTSWDCDCEWLGYIERDSFERRYTKLQYKKIKDGSSNNN